MPWIDRPTLEKSARRIAVQAHGDQRWGDHPYESHLSLVVRELREVWPHDTELRAAAWLHDVIEDTSETASSLTSKLVRDGHDRETVERVVKLVGVVTKPRGMSRKQAIAAGYLTRIFEAGPKAIALKVADRLVNVRYATGSHAKMYKGEKRTFYIQLGHGLPRLPGEKPETDEELKLEGLWMLLTQAHLLAERRVADQALHDTDVKRIRGFSDYLAILIRESKLELKVESLAIQANNALRCLLDAMELQVSARVLHARFDEARLVIELQTDGGDPVRLLEPQSTEAWQLAEDAESIQDLTGRTCTLRLSQGRFHFICWQPKA